MYIIYILSNIGAQYSWFIQISDILIIYNFLGIFDHIDIGYTICCWFTKMPDMYLINHRYISTQYVPDIIDFDQCISHCVASFLNSRDHSEYFYVALRSHTYTTSGIYIPYFALFSLGKFLWKVGCRLAFWNSRSIF